MLSGSQTTGKTEKSKSWENELRITYLTCIYFLMEIYVLNQAHAHAQATFTFVSYFSTPDTVPSTVIPLGGRLCCYYFFLSFFNKSANASRELVDHFPLGH